MMADVTAKMIKELRDMTGIGMMDAKKVLVKVEGNIEKAVDFLRENSTAKTAKKNDHTTVENLANVATVGNVAAIAEVNSETGFVSKNEMFQDSVKDIATKVVENEPVTMKETIAIKVEKGTTESDLIKTTTVIGEKVSFRRFEVIEKADNTVFGAYLRMGGRTAVLTVIDDIVDEEITKDAAMHITIISPCYINESQIPQEELEHEKAVLTGQVLNESKPANIVEKMVVGRLQKFKAGIALVGQLFVKDPDMTVEKFVAPKDGEVKSLVRLEAGEGIEKCEDDFAGEVMSQMKN